MATSVADRGVCRSRDAVLGGVCAGLADRFDLDPIVVRILAVLITLLTAGVGFVVYLVLWVRLPREDDSAMLYDVLPESAESNAYGCVDCSTGRALGGDYDEEQAGVSFVVRLAIAICLIMLFFAVALNLSPYVPGTEWWQFWPISLLTIGLCLIVIPVSSRYEAAWHALGIVVTAAAATLLPISLGIVAWQTLPFALSRAWLLLVLAAIMFAIGFRRKNNALMIGASFFVVAFFVFALMACSLPGDAQSLMLHMPDGRTIVMVPPSV